MENSQDIRPIVAAAYMRVSTARQEDEETIEGQRVEIIERLEKDGLTISRDFLYEDDGWTGSLKSRPALDRMLEDARKKFLIDYMFMTEVAFLVILSLKKRFYKFCVFTE